MAIGGFPQTTGAVREPEQSPDRNTQELADPIMHRRIDGCDGGAVIIESMDKPSRNRVDRERIAAQQFRLTRDALHGVLD